MTRHIYHNGQHYQTRITTDTANLLASVVYFISGGRLSTRRGERILKACRQDWNNLAAETQRLLDKERAMGWGFSSIDGRRIDFKY